MTLFLIFLFSILLILATKILFELNKKVSTIKVWAFLAVFSVLFTSSSLFWTKDIAYDTGTIQHLEFGWPISFETQNQNRYDPPFPFLMGYSLGVPSIFIWKNFFCSLFLNAVMWGVIFTLCATLFQKIGFRIRPLSMKHFFVFLAIVVGALVVIYVSKAIYLKGRGFDNPVILPSSVSLPTPTPRFNER